VEFVSRISELKTVSEMLDTEFTLTWVITQKDFIGVRETVFFFYTNKYNHMISNISLMSETVNGIMKYISCAGTISGRVKHESQLFFQSQID
jgi:hypothetical protein